jgi:hypothetical protein
MNATTTNWATLTYDPKETSSQINGTEYTAAVTIDDQPGRLYWKIGGLCDHLRKGDTVMVEWIKGKWKIAKTQTPELMKTLEQRRGIPAAPSDAPTATRRGNGDDVAEIAAIVQALVAVLPGWEEQAIASLACTVFISRHGKR